MSKILTTQADMDKVFRKMERDYGALNKKQQAYAIREVGRVRGYMADMLADYAGKDGVIKRNRMASLLRDMDAIEESLRRDGTIAIEKAIADTSDWTTKRVAPPVGIQAPSYDRINKHVVNYVVKRFGEDGLVLSDRVWGLSGEIRDEMSTVIRSGIIRGDAVSTMILKIRKVYDNETWKIRRLARNESVMAQRAAITYNAEQSDIVKWVEFYHGDENTPACVNLSREDRYDKGAGIFKPDDTDIILPHVNCTSWISYVVDY